MDSILSAGYTTGRYAKATSQLGQPLHRGSYSDEDVDDNDDDENTLRSHSSDTSKLASSVNSGSQQLKQTSAAYAIEPLPTISPSTSPAAFDDISVTRISQIEQFSIVLRL
jgi:hypothetical protein